MSYKVTFNGGKKDEVKKAVEEQSDANIKAQTMDDKGKAQVMKLIDALPDDARISGSVEDHNNGTVIINVTSRTDFSSESEAAATVAGKGMPGAGAAGRPDLVKGAKDEKATAKQ